MNGPNFNASCSRGGRTCSPYLGGTICFLAFVFAFTVGLIVGAFAYETFLPVIAAVIAFAAATLVVIIALLIYWYINKQR